MGWVIFMAHQNNGNDFYPAPVVKQPTRARVASNGRSAATLSSEGICSATIATDGRNSVEVQ